VCIGDLSCSRPRGWRGTKTIRIDRENLRMALLFAKAATEITAVLTVL
jgi:hypothetical protein